LPLNINSDFGLAGFVNLNALPSDYAPTLFIGCFRILISSRNLAIVAAGHAAGYATTGQQSRKPAPNCAGCTYVAGPLPTMGAVVL